MLALGYALSHGQLDAISQWRIPMNFKSLIIGLALVGTFAPVMPMQEKKKEEQTFFQRNKWIIGGTVVGLGVLAYCYRDTLKSCAKSVCRYFGFCKNVDNADAIVDYSSDFFHRPARNLSVEGAEQVLETIKTPEVGSLTLANIPSVPTETVKTLVEQDKNVASSLKYLAERTESQMHSDDMANFANNMNTMDHLYQNKAPTSVFFGDINSLSSETQELIKTGYYLQRQEAR